jgi:hypothetical protein
MTREPLILPPKTVIEYHGFCTMEECPVCHDRECKAPRWWGLFLRHRGIQIIEAVYGPKPFWQVANYRTDLRLLLKGNKFNEPF